MKVIFISQPYSFNPLEAYLHAKVYSRYVASKCYLPVSPILMFHWVYNNGDSYEQIIYNCFKLIHLCDEVWTFPLDNINSLGMAAEAAYANTLCKTITTVTLTKEEYEHYQNTFIENKS